MNFSLVVIMFSISAYVLSFSGLVGVTFLWILTIATRVTYEAVKRRLGIRGFWAFLSIFFILFILYRLLSQLYFSSASTEITIVFIILILLLSSVIFMFLRGITQIFISWSIYHRLDRLVLLIAEGTLSDSKMIASAYRAVFEIYLHKAGRVIASFALVMVRKSWSRLIKMRPKERDEILLEWAVNTGGMIDFSSYAEHRDAWRKTPGFLSVTRQEAEGKKP